MNCQQLLILYLYNSAIDSKVIAWTFWDGCSKKDISSGSTDNPPYNSGLDALRDGWRLIQMSQLYPRDKSEEYNTSILKYEFMFEKIKLKDENQTTVAFKD